MSARTPRRAGGTTVDVATSLAAISPHEWDALTDGNPFLSHAFLSALEDTGCATAHTGWTPSHLLLREDGALRGAVPLYRKDHSYGEYVFDWAWADAYQRHGFDYYPKLVAAVPFTPVAGPRLLARTAAHREQLIGGALQLARDIGVSSLHFLFPTAAETAELAAHGLMVRRGVQFHWRNECYADFDAFLGALNHEKRKKIKQERRRVRDAGIAFDWLEGAAIAPEDWVFFHRCYRNTYRAHGSTPYLNLAFFQRIGSTLREQLLLVIARRAGRPVAASLNVRRGSRLYGRYWGSVEYEPGLHFETCYYQAIEYCIARGVAVFEGGAQGEHKMARGLLPSATSSAHWLAHPQFAQAVEAFLEREGRGLAHYVSELAGRTPFKRDGESEAD